MTIGLAGICLFLAGASMAESTQVRASRTARVTPLPTLNLSAAAGSDEATPPKSSRSQRPRLKGYHKEAPPVPRRFLKEPSPPETPRGRRAKSRRPASDTFEPVTLQHSDSGSTEGGFGGGSGTGSPPPSASFEGIPDNLTVFNPDTQGAVGPNHIMITLASEVRIQNRDGTEVSTVSLDAFWAGKGNPEVFDPRITYDPYANRWIHCAVANVEVDPGLLVAVSQTDDPTGNWNRYFIDVDVNDPLFADSPNLGFNKNWIVVQANMFSAVSFDFADSHVFAFDKARLYNGDPVDFTEFTLDASQYGDAVNAQVPAATYDPDVNELHLVGHWNNSFINEFGFPAGAVRIYTISGTPASPVFTAGLIPKVTGPWDRFAFGDFDFLPQAGTTNKIAAGDCRVQDVVFRNGSLWVVHHIFLPEGAAARTAIQWWEFTPTTGFLFQLDRIDDAVGGVSFAYPSIAVNQNNDVLIGFNLFHESIYPSAAYAFRTDQIALDPPSILRDPMIFKEGLDSFYVPNGIGKNRWGDWSATVVDPVNDFDMWTLQEYAAAKVDGEDRWGTWWARVSPPVDLVLTLTNSPTTILAGDNITYDITVTNRLDGHDGEGQLASGVKVFNILPANTLFVSAFASQGTCIYENGTVVCDLGDLDVMAEATVAITLTANSSGQLMNTVTARASGTDVNILDNTQSTVTSVNPAADLSVGMAAGPNPVEVGEDLGFIMTITNLGPSSANLVRITNNVPDGVTLLTVDVTQGACFEVGRQVWCNLGTIAGGNTASATFVYRPNTPGLITNNFTIRSPITDRDLSNNDHSAVILINAAPTIQSLSRRTILEDESLGPVAFTVDDLETDPDDLVLTTSSSNTDLVPPENIVIGGTGMNRTLTVTPLPNQFGSSLITRIVTDEQGGAATNTFQLIVTSVNDAPTITGINDQTIDEDTTTTALPFTIGDVEKAPDSLILSGVSDNIALIPASRIFLTGSGPNRFVQVAPLTNKFGVANISLTVSDGGKSTQAVFRVTVDSVNDLPTISDIPDQVMDEDSTSSPAIFSVGDVESNVDALAISSQSTDTDLLPPGSVVFSGSTASRSMVISPAPDRFGTATVTVTVTDLDGGTRADSFNLTVNPDNDPPEIDPIADITDDEDPGIISVPLTGISGGPFESEGVSITAVTGDANLVPDPVVVYTSPQDTGRLEITPVTNAFGTTTITVSLDDAQGEDNTFVTTFDITLNPVNDPPRISAIGDQAIDEDGTTGPLDFTVTDPESDAATLTLSASSSDETLVPADNIQFSGSDSDRTVTVQPAPDAFGTVTITLRANDGEDAGERAFQLTINPVNDPPTITAIADQATDEDTPTGAITFFVGDAESDASTLTVSGRSSDPSVVRDANFSFMGTGSERTLVLSPEPDAFGETIITVWVADQDTGTNSQAFALMVNAVNDPPAFDAPPPFTMDEDGGITNLTLTGITSGAANENQPLTFTAVSSNPDILPDPVVTYSSPDTTATLALEPSLNANGPVEVQITIDDGSSVNQTATRTLEVTINPVNDDPTISLIDPQSTDEDVTTAPIPFVVGDLESPADLLTVTGFSSNEELVFSDFITFGGSGSNRTVTIEPLPEQFGSTFIFITVEDPDGGSRLTQFQLTVNEVDDPPGFLALPAQIALDEDTGSGVHNVDVYDQETPPFLLMLTARSPDQSFIPDGSISLGGSGINRTVSFQPATNAFGSGSIDLMVFDGINTTTSSVPVIIHPINDPPTLDPVADQTIREDEDPVAVAISGITTGPTNENQVPILVAMSSDPGIVLNPVINHQSQATEATVLIQSAPDGFGTATISLTVFDGEAINSIITREFNVTVQPVNDPPAIQPVANQIINEDEPLLNLPVTVIDSDSDLNAVTVVAASDNPSLVSNTDIAVTGTGGNRFLSLLPQAEQSGTVNIEIRATDAEGLSATNQFQLTVTEVNDAPVISQLADRATDYETPTAPIPFRIADEESAAEDLTISVESHNTPVVPLENIVLGGSGTNRTVQITPADDTFGSSIITLIVTDPDGESTAEAFRLNVSGPVRPAFTELPQSTTNFAGGTATFTTAGTGLPAPTIQWWFAQSRPLPGETNNSLVLSDVTTSDAGIYQVILSNDGGFEISPFAFLTVLEVDFGDAPAPFPTQLGENGARHVMDGLTFMGSRVDYEPEGQPDPGADGDDGDGTDDEDGVSVRTEMNAGQTAEVEVVVSRFGFLNAWIDFNGNGSWDDPDEHVFIDENLAGGLNALTLEVPLSTRSGQVAARFRFASKSGLGYDGPADNGEVEDYLFTVNAVSDLVLRMTDQVDPLPVGSNLVYSISVSNAGPSMATSVVFSDTLPASASYVDVVASVGSCTVSSGLVRCDLGDLPVGNVANIDLTVLPNGVGTLMNAAEVSSAERDSSPSSNLAMEETTVTDLPVVLQQPASMVATNGGTATFSIVAAGQGPIAFLWQKDGTDLPGQTGSSLTLNNIQDTDYGAYRVRLTNPSGSILSDVAELVRATSPEVTTRSVMRLASTSASLAGTVNAKGLDTMVWFEWGTDAGYGNLTPAVSIGNGVTPTDATAMINGLTPGETYHYRAVAQNLLGLATGADASFTWQATAPVIESISAGNGLMTIAFTGVANQYYEVEGSGDVNSWTVLGQAIDLGNGNFEFEDANVGVIAHRFYRVVAR